MIDLSKMEHATPEYQSINPNGLVDDGMRLKIEHCAKRVRVYLGGKIIANSIRSKLVWEVPHYPAYYFPMADVSMDCLLESDHSDRSSTRGLGALLQCARRKPPRRELRVALPAIAYFRDLGARAFRMGSDGRLVRGRRGGFRPPARSV